MGMRFSECLGLPFETQVNASEHADVDIDHANIFMQVARQYAVTESDRRMMLEGAREAWAIDRIWKGLMADMLTEIPGP